MADVLLRSPDSCFAQLPDFAFPPKYCELRSGAQALRMHYIDEGPADAPVALLLHGEPTWSFAYRGVIRRLSDAGFRAVAPDHIGFGRSDKLPRRDQYSYAGFVDWMSEFVTRLDLHNITLVCQDWGGPIGLSVLARMPERFAAVVAANTLLPNCEAPPRGVPDWPGEMIQGWVEMSAAADDLPVSAIVGGVCVSPLSDAVLAGYDAPFPAARYKAAVLEFPSLIPIRDTMPGCAENRHVWGILEAWQKPFVTAFSDSDPTTKAWEAVFQANISGANNTLNTEIKNAGHFLQEEQPDALAAVVISVMTASTAG